MPLGEMLASRGQGRQSWAYLVALALGQIPSWGSHEVSLPMTAALGHEATPPWRREPHNLPIVRPGWTRQAVAVSCSFCLREVGAI